MFIFMPRKIQKNELDSQFLRQKMYILKHYALYTSLTYTIDQISMLTNG